VNHRDVKKHLADYLEGDLALDDRAVIDAHLDQCEECLSEVREMQQTIRLLQMLPEPETPPMIAANVMRRIRAGESRPGLFARFLRGLGTVFEPSFVLPASAVAAAALVVVFVQEPSRSELQGLMNPSNLAAARAARVPGLGAAEAIGSTVVANIAEAGAARLALNPAESSRAARLPTAPRRIELVPSASRGSRFADPILAPPIPRPFVPDSYVSNSTSASRARSSAAPATVFLRDRMGGAIRAQAVSQQRVSERSGGRSRSMRMTAGSTGGSRSAGEDPRDVWIARALEDPAGFARFLAEKTLVEQELWVSRLSQRAEARGLLGELVQSLEQSGDTTANWLAEDFSAQSTRGPGDASLTGGNAPR
jgi:hypothetical protein